MTTDWFIEAERYADWLGKQADAEVAKQQGGCLMLSPSQNDALNLAIPGGEPPEDLHVTLIYFGEDVTDFPGADQEISQTVQGVADQYSVITARVFGHATFNPDGANGREPCAVYLLGDSQDLETLHGRLYWELSNTTSFPDQHSPWCPHITAGYSMDPGSLGFTGDVQFDRIGLSWMGNTTWFPLAGAGE